MSMPSFPEDSLNITCEQAFNMLLGSIAIEEMALGHIMNAEGEKLQYVLGTLPGRPCTCATPKEVLEVNRSISDLLERVAYNQILLKGKLQQVLEARESCLPPEPPCPPKPPCACVWAAERNRPWCRGRALHWKRDSLDGKDLCWQGCSPGLIHLCPENTYLASATFQLRAGAQGPVRVDLQAVRGCGCDTLMTLETCAAAPGSAVTLSGCTLLSPSGTSAIPSPLQFVLDTPDQVIVERAVFTLNIL